MLSSGKPEEVGTDAGRLARAFDLLRGRVDGPVPRRALFSTAVTAAVLE